MPLESLHTKDGKNMFSLQYLQLELWHRLAQENGCLLSCMAPQGDIIVILRMGAIIKAQRQQIIG